VDIRKDEKLHVRCQVLGASQQPYEPKRVC
jgi:hypothetical protein